MVENVDKLLAQSPLTVSEHRSRNWTAALLLAVSVLLIPILLHQPLVARFLADIVFPKAYAEGFFENVRHVFDSVPPSLSRINLPLLGWLVLPGAFAWMSVARERYTDAEFESTEKAYLHQLQHEAETAKERMLKQNLTPAEAEEIYKVIRGLGIKRYRAMRAFAARHHSVVFSSMLPWIFTSVMLVVFAIALFVVGQIEWDAFGAGLFVAALTTMHKISRFWRFSDVWAAWDLGRLPQT